MKVIGKLKTLRSHEVTKSRVGIGFECVDRELIKPEKCYDLFAQTGAKWARCQTGWARCESKRGVYDFAWLDDMVDNLTARGVEVWFNVGYGNPVYMDDVTNPTAVGCVPTLYGEETVSAWRRYVAELAERYGDRVRYWEIWNEPDCGGFWYPGGQNATQYAELIKLTGEVIREKHPNAKTVMCTAGSHLDYLEESFSVLRPGDIQLYCAHTYNRHPESCEILLRTGEIRALLDKYGHTETQMAMGEVGHASWHPVGHHFVNEGGGSESRQAIFCARKYFLDFKAGMKFTSWFIIADLAEKTYRTSNRNVKRPAEQGVLKGRIYTPKKVHGTLSYLGVLLSEETELSDKRIALTLAPDNDLPSDAPTVCVPYTRNGRDVYAYWLALPVDSDEPVRMGNTLRLPDTDIEHPIIIDTYSGAVIEPEDGEWCEKEKTLLGVPVAIHPYAVADREAFETEYV